MFTQDKYIVGHFEEASADLAIERRAGGVASASAARAARRVTDLDIIFA